jgi:hypothetical protein
MHLNANEKKARIAHRLNAYCMWRGGRMARLPGLPLTAAARFQPPDCRPEDLFVHDSAELAQYPRTSYFCDHMIRRSAPLDEILLYVDGSCLDQHISGDASQRKAGCAVIFKPEPITGSVYTLSRGWRFRLESMVSPGKSTLKQVGAPSYAPQSRLSQRPNGPTKAGFAPRSLRTALTSCKALRRTLTRGDSVAGGMLLGNLLLIRICGRRCCLRSICTRTGAARSAFG